MGKPLRSPTALQATSVSAVVTTHARVIHRRHDVGMRPMLATHGVHVPAGEEWTHEVKWDGVRAITEVRDGAVRMTSRNENTITTAWPDLSTSPLGDRDLLVDGEIIALNERGLPDFRTLQ